MNRMWLAAGIVPVVFALATPHVEAETSALAGTRFAGSKQLADVLAKKKALTVGAKGEGVKALQQALIDMGFALRGTADGAFGPMTRRSVINFQKHARVHYKGVAADGVVGAKTLEALCALAPKAGERGQAAKLPRGRYDGKRLRALVVKSEHRTFLFDDAGRVKAIFQNAVGAPGTPTPNALKRVDALLGKQQAMQTGQLLWDDPTVFGDRIIGLSNGGIELHGTNAPTALGSDVSHGCVRHANEDIVFMFSRVKVGELVAIVDKVNDPHLK